MFYMPLKKAEGLHMMVNSDTIRQYPYIKHLIIVSICKNTDVKCNADTFSRTSCMPRHPI